ncbi:MAG TPA: DUF3298 domain-containing protein [Candidatus Paceibacterota bacterium]|nr:DUF3298 domain-containing protein [Candidatus Paceibacterota bacterium]
MNPQLARHLGIAAIALAILGAVIWYLALYPAPALAPEETATSTPPVGSGAPATITESAAYYEIEAAYPSSISFPLSSRSDAGVNAQASMKQWVVQSIAEFKANSDFENLSPEDIELLRLDERKYALDIKYSAYAGERTASYVYTITQDTGGAHPNTLYRTFTFDATTGAEVTLADLFLPGSDHLSRLSSIARRELPDIIGQYADATFVEAGTAADAKNFESFYLDGERIVFLFPPYQVGPYSLGAVALPLELPRLSSILRPEYQ